MQDPEVRQNMPGLVADRRPQSGSQKAAGIEPEQQIQQPAQQQRIPEGQRADVKPAFPKPAFHRLPFSRITVGS